MIDGKMLLHILKCTVVKGERVMGDWDLTMEELEQFVGLR